MGGYGKAVTIVGLFFIVGVIAALFLPETRGRPLPHALWRDPAAVGLVGATVTAKRALAKGRG
jgi:hypothetical protein